MSKFSDNRSDNKIQEDRPAEVHYVPFKVEYDGNANVGTKFSSKSVELKDEATTGDDRNKVFENQFRGKPLMGKEMVLPEDYEGLVCTDFSKSSSVQPEGETESSSMICVTKGFKTMKYWNWDKPPSGMDTPIQLLDWLDLSKVLHEPVEEESQGMGESECNS